jgi:mannose-6-phosphate isomerase-like protein (cupin superfamily)
VTDEERGLPVLRHVEGHHRPAPFYLTADMFGGLPVELVAAEVSGLVDRPLAEVHRHTVPEIYVLLSRTPGEAEIEVELEGQLHKVVSPGVFMVPAGARHRFVTRRAAPGSYCLGVLIGDEHEPREEG